MPSKLEAKFVHRVWGKFDLAPGEHTLRVVVKGRPFQSSTGAWVNIEDLVTYQK